MLSGVMVLWWILTVPSFLFVVVDIPRTPEAPIVKWAFVILTAFAGPLGAFFYVLGCREPLRGTHEEFVVARWRQVLGSTMHCVAGDGIGIVAGAAAGSVLTLSFWPDFLLEYALGFGFGWAFFQAFAMRDMAGGSYLRSLRMTFLPELVSMNLLMTGMVLTSSFAMMRVGGAQPGREGRDDRGRLRHSRRGARARRPIRHVGPPATGPGAVATTPTRTAPACVRSDQPPRPFFTAASCLWPTLST